MEIKPLTNHDEELWEKVAEYAEHCSWGDTAKYLSNRMKNNEFLDWERVFVALENKTIKGFCALSKTCHPYSIFCGKKACQSKYCVI